MSVEQFQNLVIGSGVAGKIIAWTLAKRGQRTIVVERAMIGGSCPNVACLPSKNVIYSAKAVSLVHPTTGLGVVTGTLHVDMAGVVRRKRQMVDDLVKLHLDKEGGFFYTSNDHEQLFARAKDQYDGAQPSGNSMAASNLVTLWIKTGDAKYSTLAEKTIKSLAAPLKTNPTALTGLAHALGLYLDALGK